MRAIAIFGIGVFTVLCVWDEETFTPEIQGRVDNLNSKIIFILNC